MVAALLAVVAAPSSASTYEVIHSFAVGDEGYVQASPASDGRGNLYGYTDFKDCDNPCLYGGLYRYSVLGRAYETVYDFSAEAYYPAGSPVGDNGVVYGVLRKGGVTGQGAAFKYDPAAGMKMLSFPNGNPFYAPLTGLTVTPSGEVFGLATYGIYKINRAFTQVTWVHTFTWPVSSNPGSMAQEKGTLYGGTSTFNFQFEPATGAFVSNPASEATLGLTFDDAGSLWSVLPRSISRFGASYALKTVHRFTSATGNTPRSGMVLGADGLLYGVTERGGACADCGTIYSLDPATGRYSTLHAFKTAGPGGRKPYGLVKGDDGALYGHAGGGLFAGGVLFRFVP